MFLNRPIAEFRKAKAYLTLCSLVLISISMPAASQILRGNCGNPDPDISIAGCTKKIQSDTTDLQSGRGNMQAAAANLATDYDNRQEFLCKHGKVRQICAKPPQWEREVRADLSNTKRCNAGTPARS